MTAIAWSFLLSALAQAPATAPASSPAGEQNRASWLPRSEGPWNNDLGVLILSEDKPPQAGSPAAIQHASAPTLAVIRGERVIAAFEYFSHDDRRDFAVLASSESTDGGKSWSKPHRLELKGLATDDGRPRMPALLALPNGRLRLYVTLYPRKGRSLIASLISTDGRTFDAEPDRRFALRDASVSDPIVLASGSTIHLFARRAGRSRELVHAISKDGLRFDPLPDVRVDSPLAQPPAVRDAALLATPRGVLLIGTNDGANWFVSATTGIPPTTDIASTRLTSGASVALFVPDGSRSPDGRRLVMGKRRDADSNIDPKRNKPEEISAPAEPSVSPADSTTDPNAAGEWPPEPDFLSPIDYVAWIRERAEQNTTDDAQPYYREFMLKQDADGHWVTAIPLMSGMWNTQYDGDGAPWKPDEHPDWEQSYQSSLQYLERYRAAASHSDYSTNILIDPDTKGPALMNFLLPDLSTHRMLCKEILSAAWRAPDGKVDPDAMLSAWQTTLSSARHLKSGVTLIEELVGDATTNLTYSDARQALAQGAIPPDRLEDALKTLQQYSPGRRDPTNLLTGEAAFAADMVQYVTDTNTSDGVPHLNPERVQEMAAFVSDKPMPPEDLDEILKKDPRDISSALRNFYRDTADAMRTGYPEVTSKQLNEIAARYEAAHPEIAPILPSLGRVEALMTRNEASRRATQLAYAVNIFKARQGRWPTSLDELPAAQAADARIDPFTKRDFHYQVGPNGPVIYSASENGKDDGGRHAPRWGDDKKDDDASDDYVFWPPQPRPKSKPAP